MNRTDGPLFARTIRPPTLRAFGDELIVDNFAGGGGASLGIEWALGRSPDIAVNHDPEAVAMHAANHPETRHLCGDVWEVDPVAVTGRRRVGLAWFSPDCTYHSFARGSRPFRQEDGAPKRRALAFVVIRWARAVRPRVIILENVREFADWGPLDNDGNRIVAKKGLSFRIWLGKLRAAGYQVEMRELAAMDYGAPTTRKRLFIIARCDGQPIVWPEPTHGPGRAQPYRVAAECIEWALPCPSIFGRKKPLVENTLKRIARGIDRFVLNDGSPFIIPNTHPGDQRVYDVREPFRTITAAKRGELSLISPTLIQQGWGEREGQAPRTLDIRKPIGTIVAGGVKHALVAAFLAKHNGGHEPTGVSMREPIHTITTKDHHHLVASHLLHLRGSGPRGGRSMAEPLPTITAGGTHLGEVRAFLYKYYRTGVPASLQLPLDTLTTKPRYGIVYVHGEPYEVADIGQRMLVPRELFRGNGFADSYVIDVIVNGKPLSITAQVRMCGNSVCPPMAEALVRANVAIERTAAA